MNSSINFSTFLHTGNKSIQKIRRENNFTTEINDVGIVDSEKNAMKKTPGLKDQNFNKIRSK